MSEELALARLAKGAADDERFGRLRVRSVAIGALALAAQAVGALAISRLAIRRMAAGHAAIHALEIEELSVQRLRVGGRLFPDEFAAGSQEPTARTVP